MKTALSEQSATRFGRWVDDVLAAGRGRGLHAIVGAMTQREVSHYTGAAGVAPATAEIAVEDRLLVGRKADRHAREASALTPDERKRLPLALANERRSYFDRLEKKMIYVLPSLDADRPVKIAVQVDVSAGHPKRALNIARAGHKINVQALAARTRYEPIEEA
ncbi:hypothetical protein [Accumulibacter sp.]|uniref:hypothetical protein n=1 Tax=Accumulibacter sp. TaxID=2053492 RepID=UPI0025DCE8C4|nr:hypothetical protein [Accumulibacter sp.]MCM8596466.1 hypothetical protein [Accumulibacter sp.]MCM8627362.1 hypothetical protein [Accumulibacter sp.]MDS4050614.1 hypothetical protein [Accumulibacter sp.]